tara:strand:+ start:136 stop:501 length:366 start_codon:yes stop_codon:yes gene_type:complete
MTFTCKKSFIETCSFVKNTFQNVLEKAAVCFVGGGKYLSDETGWIHRREIYSVELPRKLTKRGASVIFVGKEKKRRKVRMSDGVQFVILGPNTKWPTLRATSTQYDIDEIEAHNSYWMMTN